MAQLVRSRKVRHMKLNQFKLRKACYVLMFLIFAYLAVLTYNEPPVWFFITSAIMAILSLQLWDTEDIREHFSIIMKKLEEQ